MSGRLRRWLIATARWILDRAQVNRLEAHTGPDQRTATLAIGLYVYEESRDTPLLLAHMVKAYCRMHGVQVEIATAPVPVEPATATNQGIVH